MFTNIQVEEPLVFFSFSFVFSFGGGGGILYVREILEEACGDIKTFDCQIYSQIMIHDS